MYVVTNREIRPDESGLKKFGKRPNALGPNELRLARVTRKGTGWQVEILEDDLPADQAKALIEKYDLELDPTVPHYASLAVACDVADRAWSSSSHVLLFVHGYNNDMEDVVGRAFEIQDRYGVEVVVFSWPANGGGIGGVVGYKADKRDARASTGALERTLEKTHLYFQLLTAGRRRKLWKAAEKKEPLNAEARNALYARLLEKDCPFTVNGLFHSMGNYVLKQMLKSTIAAGTGLIFDNVVLAAADTNNLDHELWVDGIRFRKRCFVTINENDFALSASRAKAGSNQLARLGHFLRNLEAANAHYVNFTDASWVRNSHAYFVGEPLKNAAVAEFFQGAFTGKAAEDNLRYRAEGNWFTF